jgi:HEAT repeats
MRLAGTVTPGLPLPRLLLMASAVVRTARRSWHANHSPLTPNPARWATARPRRGGQRADCARQVNAALTYYCWHCYAAVTQPTGTCQACGRPVEGPAGLDYADQLLWALHHPLPDRQMIAAQILGARRERRAVQPLRAVLASTGDPYLAAEALLALVRITGVRDCQDVLTRYAASGPALVRRVARDQLGGTNP